MTTATILVATAVLVIAVSVLTVRRFRRAQGTFDTLVDSIDHPGTAGLHGVETVIDLGNAPAQSATHLEPVPQEPMGSGDVPMVNGDKCFRCHKEPAETGSLWCEVCRYIVWGIGAEPIERTADR